MPLEKALTVRAKRLSNSAKGPASIIRLVANVPASTMKLLVIALLNSILKLLTKLARWHKQLVTLHLDKPTRSLLQSMPARKLTRKRSARLKCRAALKLPRTTERRRTESLPIVDCRFPIFFNRQLAIENRQ